MKVRVSYMAQLRQAAGRPWDEVSLSAPATTASAVAAAAAANPAIAPLVLGPSGHVRRSLLAFRGDEQLAPDSPLEADCEIALMTPIAGGAGRLTDAERAVYEWQMWSPGFGEEGQLRLKRASVLVSRVGGVGGNVAYQLAAAGVGRLILAHAGDIRPGDLNRQLLMTHEGLGRPRLEIAPDRLRALNPRLEVVAVQENANDDNASRLVAQADLVVSCAPLFAERLALNRAAVAQGKPLVDCAMYDFDLQVTTVLPGQGPCLACLYPEEPPAWKRQFPVFGAVAGVAGCLGAVEAIKVLAGLGEPLAGRLLLGDLRAMSFRRVQARPLSGCPICGPRPDNPRPSQFKP